MKMNKVMLMGRLTADAELRYTPNGVAVASFTLAVARRFKREGEPEADFINCVIWQKPAENLANMVGKGCRVEIVGRWNTRNYEGQDGKRVYVNECVIEEATFIDYRDNGQGAQNGPNKPQNNPGNQSQGQGQQQRGGGQNGGQRGQYDPFAGNNGQIDINDDDLPF
jgi:single-strand DNA-binding protein